MKKTLGGMRAETQHRMKGNENRTAGEVDILESRLKHMQNHGLVSIEGGQGVGSEHLIQNHGNPSQDRPERNCVYKNK